MKNNKQDEIVEMHVIISGYVQGVGFRATTLHFALGLKIKGIVRNLPSGTVEIYAQGKKEELDSFLEKINNQFKPYIEDMAVNYGVPKKEFKDFSIST